MYKKKLDYKDRGAIAPHMCLQSTCNAAALPFREGMQKEREIFKVLVSSGILFCIRKNKPATFCSLFPM